MIDAEGENIRFFNGKWMIADGSQPRDQSGIICLKMEPVIDIRAVRISVVVGRVWRKNNDLWWIDKVVFRTNMKDTMRVYDKQNEMRKTLWAAHSIGAGVYGITATSDCLYHNLAS